MKPLFSARIAGNVVTFVIDEGLRRNRLVNGDLVVEYGDETDLSACPESLLAIPALANLAPIVWLSGETYSIPVLDAVFANSLERIRRELIARYPEASWEGKLVPDALERAAETEGLDEGDESRVALLFSSGSIPSTARSRSGKGSCWSPAGGTTWATRTRADGLQSRQISRASRAPTATSRRGFGATSGE